MAVSFDSDVYDKAILLLDNTTQSLNSDIKNKILVDYDSFIKVNLFSTQLNEIKASCDNFEKLLTTLKSSIQTNKSQWVSVDDGVGQAISGIYNYGGNYNGSYGNNTGSGYKGSNSNYQSSSNMNNVNSGVSVRNEQVTNYVDNMDDYTMANAVKSIFNMKGDKDMSALLTDPAMSGVLVAFLKKILGDTSSDLNTESTADSTAIQKAFLEKINKNNHDLTTEAGKNKLEEEVMETIKNPQITGNVKTINILSGTFVVANTVSNIQDYASFVSNNGVKQDVDTAKYGDSCLSFAYSHAYDLFTGSRTNTAQAGNYAHASSFSDYFNDNKNETLSKIYSEIMSGRPVVLQVNGNTAGTSRHFVTVVGFNSNVLSSGNLTEKDLLIMDSWDGKVERMDTEKSRFMTTGAACGKDYSGYYLRVLKA